VGPLVRGKAASFADSIRLWTTVDGCTTPPLQRDLPDLDRDDASTVHLDAYTCAHGAAVDAYTITGGGHAWPGSKQRLPRKLVGPVNRDVDATTLMWSFFAAHPAD
jgi:polyhydroxybutyrate depolymerase